MGDTSLLFSLTPPENFSFTKLPQDIHLQWVFNARAHVLRMHAPDMPTWTRTLSTSLTLTFSNPPEGLFQLPQKKYGQNCLTETYYSCSRQTWSHTTSDLNRSGTKALTDPGNDQTSNPMCLEYSQGQGINSIIFTFRNQTILKLKRQTSATQDIAKYDVHGLTTQYLAEANSTLLEKSATFKTKIYFLEYFP